MYIKRLNEWWKKNISQEQWPFLFWTLHVERYVRDQEQRTVQLWRKWDADRGRERGRVECSYVQRNGKKPVLLLLLWPRCFDQLLILGLSFSLSISLSILVLLALHTSSIQSELSNTQDYIASRESPKDFVYIDLKQFSIEYFVIHIAMHFAFDSSERTSNGLLQVSYIFDSSLAHIFYSVCVIIYSLHCYTHIHTVN